MSTPPTPTHVAPDVEAELPPTPFVSADMDLNPDLDEDDSSINTKTENGITAPEYDSNGNNGNYAINGNDVNTEMVEPWTLLFDEAYELQKKQFEQSSQNKLSRSQQSRFVSFVDEELLQIQRRFVKKQAGEQEYTLEQILNDVQHVLDLVWVLVNAKNRLYGQEEYFVKICGDLEDWLVHFSLSSPTLEEHVFLRFFTFFQSLDVRLSFLIDGFEVQGTPLKMSPTQLVRLMPIVSRLRLQIVNMLEPTRAQMEKSGLKLLNKLDVAIGRLFEGVLDRV